MEVRDGENDLTTWIREKITAEVVIAFVLGVFLGLFVLGWRVFPVAWTNTDPADLKPSHKEVYLQMITIIHIVDRYLLVILYGLAASAAVYISYKRSGDVLKPTIKTTVP